MMDNEYPYPEVIDIDGDAYFYDESMEGVLTGDDCDAIILDMMADEEMYYDEDDDVI